MNLSLGRPVVESYKKDPLCQAVERAWKAGIVVVVAAGNQGRNNTKNTNGYGTIMSPGNDPLVITVGAINHKANYDPADDIIASYSSKGPSAIDLVVKPDIVAPGNQLLSLQAPNATLTTQYPANRPAGNEIFSSDPTTPSTEYFRMSGTSMAAPLVSGIAAMMIGLDLTLTPDQVKARLMKTARRAGLPKKAAIYDPITKLTYNASHDVFTIGAGGLESPGEERLCLARAVEAHQRVCFAEISHDWRLQLWDASRDLQRSVVVVERLLGATQFYESVAE